MMEIDSEDEILKYFFKAGIYFINRSSSEAMAMHDCSPTICLFFLLSSLKIIGTFFYFLNTSMYYYFLQSSSLFQKFLFYFKLVSIYSCLFDSYLYYFMVSYLRVMNLKGKRVAPQAKTRGKAENHRIRPAVDCWQVFLPMQFECQASIAYYSCKQRLYIRYFFKTRTQLLGLFKLIISEWLNQTSLMKDAPAQKRHQASFIQRCFETFNDFTTLIKINEQSIVKQGFSPIQLISIGRQAVDHITPRSIYPSFLRYQIMI